MIIQTWIEAFGEERREIPPGTEHQRYFVVYDETGFKDGDPIPEYLKVIVSFDPSPIPADNHALALHVSMSPTPGRPGATDAELDFIGNHFYDQYGLLCVEITPEDGEQWSARHLTEHPIRSANKDHPCLKQRLNPSRN